MSAEPEAGADTVDQRSQVRVSLIIPAHNAADVLPTALASVAGQTRPPDEVVVIDDGSSDGTAALAEQWAGFLPIHVIRLEENIGAGIGAGGVRHRGIQASSGQVIALLDADDVLLPDHLEVLLRLHAERGGLVTANHLMWVPGAALGNVPVGSLNPVPAPEKQRQVLFAENFVFIGSVFDRALYDRVGGFRPIPCEDWDLWIRMVEAGAVVSMPDQVTALYRSWSGSVSAGDRLLEGDIRLLAELRNRVAGDEAAAVDAALRRRRARKLYLHGIAEYQAGRGLAARRAWLRSLLTDPSPRRNNSRMNGNIAVRALVCLVAPGRMIDRRSRRRRSGDVQVGND